MGLEKSAIIPVASLSAICGVGLVFIMWWFPRTFAKGNAQELVLLEQDRAERARQAAIARGENEATDDPSALEAQTTVRTEQPVRKPQEYRPPVAGLG